jgi:valyl-tRNA synthetase
MSKSKGNVVTPVEVLEEHGSDAIRYWACSARPGTDTALDVNQFRVGRRLAIKILNASRFVLGLSPAGAGGEVSVPVDQALLARLSALVAEATASFEQYDYARALERTEAFFWAFCDDYVELVKGRAYGAHGQREAASANEALELALSIQLRLFAPFLPFVTEEVWSWWRAGSVHRAPWPAVAEISVPPDAATTALEEATWVLGEIRRAKTDAKLSMRAPVEKVVVRAPAERLAELRQAEADLKEAGSVAGLVLEEDPEPAVRVELAG